MRGIHEKNLPTEQQQTQEDPRVSSENGNQGGTKSPSKKKGKRPPRLDSINFSFTKAHRLTKKRDFARIQKAGKRFTTPSCRLTYLFSEAIDPKLGLTVSKKYGKAHDRNLFKRWAREIFRKNKYKVPRGLEINLAPGMQAEPITYNRLESDLLKFIQTLWPSIPNN